MRNINYVWFLYYTFIFSWFWDVSFCIIPVPGLNVMINIMVKKQ